MSDTLFTHGTGTVTKVAELICQKCEAVSYARLPTHRTDTMQPCECGGTGQVVRVVAPRDLRHG